MDNILIRFTQNNEMREAVRAHLQMSLDAEGLDRIYKRMDTGHIADARVAIDNAFNNLQQQYAPKKPRVKKIPANK